MQPPRPPTHRGRNVGAGPEGWDPTPPPQNQGGTFWVRQHATTEKSTLREQQQGGTRRAGPCGRDPTYRIPRGQLQGETPWTGVYATTAKSNSQGQNRGWTHRREPMRPPRNPTHMGNINAGPYGRDPTQPRRHPPPSGQHQGGTLWAGPYATTGKSNPQGQ